MLAVRQSKLTGPRRAVLAILATYTDQDGNNAFPKWATLARESGASRRTVSRAIREALEAGEIECTGERKSKTKIYSFAPLIHSATLAPCQPDTPRVPQEQGIVPPWHSHGVTLAPDQVVIKQGTRKEQKNPRDVGAVGNTSLQGLDSSKSNGNGKAPVDEKEIQAAKERIDREEREGLEAEHAILLTQQEKKPNERTKRAIEELRAQLDGAEIV